MGFRNFRRHSKMICRTHLCRPVIYSLMWQQKSSILCSNAGLLTICGVLEHASSVLPVLQTQRKYKYHPLWGVLTLHWNIQWILTITNSDKVNHGFRIQSISMIVTSIFLFTLHCFHFQVWSLPSSEMLIGCVREWRKERSGNPKNTTI